MGDVTTLLRGILRRDWRRHLPEAAKEKAPFRDKRFLSRGHFTITSLSITPDLRPSLHFPSSTQAPRKGTPGHSIDRAAFSGMSIGEKGMIYAAKIMSSTALDLFLNPAKLAEVTSEWKERIKTKAPYQMMLQAGSWPSVPKENPPGFRGPDPPQS